MRKNNLKAEQHLAASSSNIGIHKLEKVPIELDMKRITRNMTKEINAAKSEKHIEKVIEKNAQIEI